MQAAALLMLGVSALTIWGSLVLAIFNLSRHPEEAED